MIIKFNIVVLEVKYIKFKRFEVHTTKRTTNFKFFNLELKLAGFIFNIEKFV